MKILPTGASKGKKMSAIAEQRDLMFGKTDDKFCVALKEAVSKIEIHKDFDKLCCDWLKRKFLQC